MTRQPSLYLRDCLSLVLRRKVGPLEACYILWNRPQQYVTSPYFGYDFLRREDMSEEDLGYYWMWVDMRRKMRQEGG